MVGSDWTGSRRADPDLGGQVDNAKGVEDRATRVATEWGVREDEHEGGSTSWECRWQRRWLLAFWRRGVHSGVHAGVK